MMVRPLSRKDIFYSGSVMNLPEYQSQKSLANYRQSVISLSKSVRGDMKDDIEKAQQRKYTIRLLNTCAILSITCEKGKEECIRTSITHGS